MAVFDVVVNNADRKGGHVLAMPDGHRFGVDHGVSFHVDDKLRTVLWGWAGEPLDPDDADGRAPARRAAAHARASELPRRCRGCSPTTRWRPTPAPVRRCCCAAT